MKKWIGLAGIMMLGLGAAPNPEKVIRDGDRLRVLERPMAAAPGVRDDRRVEWKKKPVETVPGELIVKFKGAAAAAVQEGGASPAAALQGVSPDLDDLHRKFRPKSMKPVFPGARAAAARAQRLTAAAAGSLGPDEERIRRRLQRAPAKVSAPALENVFVVRFDLKPGEDLGEILAAYRKDPNVEYAQRNAKLSLYLAPNDPDYPSLWPMNNIGQPYPIGGGATLTGAPDADIDAPEAWELGTGSESIVVGVIDGGVDYTHPDLSANMWRNTAEQNGASGVDDDGNGFIDDIHGYDFSDIDGDPMDFDGHGTHVAGTIAARGNNATQVTGVSWKARIMAVKGFENATSEVLAQCIRYAVDMGADVLNNSWGFTERYPSDPIIEDAVTYAVSQGCIPIFAAGNNNDDASFYSPQNHVNTISVAATDANDEKAWFSNYGSEVDVAAPGLSILSTWPGGGTQVISGTSMACPHVAGATALLLSHNPALTYTQVRDILRTVGDPAPAGLTINGKRLNLHHAVVNVKNGNLAPTVDAGGPYTVKHPQTGVTVTGAVTDDGKPGTGVSYAWTLAKGPAPVTFSNPNALSTGVTFTVSGRYILRLSASDGVLNSFDQAVVEVSKTRQIGEVVIDGQDMEASDDFAYVSGGELIRKINISNPQAPAIVATYQGIGADFSRISVLGNTIFAVDKAKRLVAVDASTMALISAVSILNVQDVHAFGGKAYLAAGADGLKIYNVANPAAMTLAGTYNAFGSPMSMQTVRSNGIWCLVGGPDGSAVVKVEVRQAMLHAPITPWSDPEGKITARDARFSGPNLYVSDDRGAYHFRWHEHWVSGWVELERDSFIGNLALLGDNVLHLAVDGFGFIMYDIHDPYAPGVLERHASTLVVRDLEADGDLLYVLSSSRFRVMQTELPNTAPSVNLVPALGGSILSPTLLQSDVKDDGQPGSALTYEWSKVEGPGTASFASPTAASTNVTFSAPGKYLLKLEVSDGEKSSSALMTAWASRYLTRVRTLVEPPNKEAGWNNRVKVQDGFLWQMEHGTMAVYSLADPRNPGLAGVYTDFKETFRDFKVRGNYVYLAGANGLTILDFTNKAAPQRVSFLDNVSGLNEAGAVAVAGNYAYVGYFMGGVEPNNTQGTYTINVTNKAAPAAVAGAYIPGDFVSAAEVSGGALYVTSNSGLQIADLANPASPSLLSTLDVGNNYGISIQGAHVYAGNGSTLHIIDVSDRIFPAVKGRVDIDWETEYEQFHGNPVGNYLLVNNGINVSGIGVWDITNKAAPALMDQYYAYSAFTVMNKRIIYLDGAFRTEILDAAALPNKAPDAFAGLDLTGTGVIQLKGSAVDDGTAPITYAWSKVSGPGTVAFSAPAAAQTNATFSAAGTYVLRLTAGDGSLSGSDDVKVRFQGDAFLQDVSASGLVVIEAENYHGKAAQGGKDWAKTATAGSSGGAAMQAMPNSGTTVNTGYVTGSPRLDFKAAFAKTGTHYVWARGIGPTTSDDSYHAGLDNTANTTSDRIGNFGTAYAWRKADLDGGQANFNVATTGVHTVNVWMREDGFIIDKIIVTKSATYVPTGSGPAESPRGQHHYISATSSHLGTIAPAGITQVAHGANRSYAITPAEGYVVDKVLVDGISVGAPTSYTFTAVNAGHRIHATFRPATRPIPLVRAFASADDGNVPANAIDGNLATRWSAMGNPQWIAFEVGDSFMTLDKVRIAFFKGNERRTTFDIETSGDGVRWDPLIRGLVSSGTTAGFEEFDLPDGIGSFYRIVGHGNNLNTWNSLSEVEFLGY